VTFLEAVEQVINQHPDFEVQACLQQWLRKGWLTDFVITQAG
jgi:hypothetical protein